MNWKESNSSLPVGEFLIAESSIGVDNDSQVINGSITKSVDGIPGPSSAAEINCQVEEVRNDSEASSSGSPWYQLRKEATTFVSQTLQRGRKNLWQLTTSRISVLLSSAAVGSTSIHQFLKIYEDLNVFILAGEAFCGFEAVDFRQKLKAVCENYFVAFHRQNVYVSVS